MRPSTTTLWSGCRFPDEYNDWLSWLVTLKACGFTANEVENWSKAGPKYQVGEVINRWDDLKDGNPAKEWQRLLNAAPPGECFTSDLMLPWLEHKAGKAAVVTNSSIVNVEIALNALGFEGAWRYDDWNRRAEWCPDGENWTPVTDSSLRTLKHSIEKRFGHLPISFAPSLPTIRTGMEFLTESTPYNPQVQTFRQREWDGRDRWADWGALLGQHEELGVEYSKLLVRGVVVRAHHPGAVFPYCPTLYSNQQGRGKGDTLKAIANGAHSWLDEHTFVGFDVEKKVREKGRGKSILEVSEREGLSPRGQAALKSFITTEATDLRDAYAHMQSTEPVSFIVTATSNNLDFLTDAEHRRDPVIRLPQDHEVDVSEVLRLLPDLWAQACAELDGGMFVDPTVTAGQAVRLPRRLWRAALDDSAMHKSTARLYDFLNYALNELSPAKDAGRIWGKSLQDAVAEHVGRTPSQELSRTMSDVGWAKEPKRYNFGPASKRVVWRSKALSGDITPVDVVVPVSFVV